MAEIQLLQSSDIAINVPDTGKMAQAKGTDNTTDDFGTILKDAVVGAPGQQELTAKNTAKLPIARQDLAVQDEDLIEQDEKVDLTAAQLAMLTAIDITVSEEKPAIELSQGDGSVVENEVATNLAAKEQYTELPEDLKVASLEMAQEFATVSQISEIIFRSNEQDLQEGEIVTANSSRTIHLPTDDSLVEHDDVTIKQQPIAEVHSDAQNLTPAFNSAALTTVAPLATNNVESRADKIDSDELQAVDDGSEQQEPILHFDQHKQNTNHTSDDSFKHIELEQRPELGLTTKMLAQEVQHIPKNVENGEILVENLTTANISAQIVAAKSEPIITDSERSSMKDKRDDQDLSAQLALDQFSTGEITSTKIDALDPLALISSFGQLNSANDVAGTDLQQGIAKLDLPMNVNDHEWVPGLGHRILWMVDSNTKQAKIHVNPPELGPLDVQLKVVKDQTNIIFSSHNHMAKGVIEGALPKLQEMFSEQGLNLGNVQVDISSNQSGNREGSLPQFVKPKSSNGYIADNTDNAFSATRRASSGLIDYYA